jgi:hypothetical protein
VQLGTSGLALGWHSHVKEFSPIADWPACVQNNKILQKAPIDEDDEEWLDLGDFSCLPEDTLEMDDQHAAFLDEGMHQKEEDEVERLVAMIDVASELGLAEL